MSERDRARLRDEVARRRLANDREHARLEALPPRQTGSPGHLTVKQLSTARRWVEGSTYREIAAEDGVTPASIQARVNAAKLKLGVQIGGRYMENRRLLRDALCAEAA